MTSLRTPDEAGGERGVSHDLGQLQQHRAGETIEWNEESRTPSLRLCTTTNRRPLVTRDDGLTAQQFAWRLTLWVDAVLSSTRCVTKDRTHSCIVAIELQSGVSTRWHVSAAAKWTTPAQLSCRGSKSRSAPSQRSGIRVGREPISHNSSFSSITPSAPCKVWCLSLLSMPIIRRRESPCRAVVVPVTSASRGSSAAACASCLCAELRDVPGPRLLVWLEMLLHPLHFAQVIVHC